MLKYIAPTIEAIENDPDDNTTFTVREATPEEEARARELLLSPNTTFRSCWLCNRYHWHLINRDVLKCDWCDRVFAGGVDVTDVVNAEP